MNSFDKKQNCAHMKKHGGMFYLEINVGVICFFLGDARENNSGQEYSVCHPVRDDAF